jgi:prolyl 4-hydroxylase
MIFVSNNESFGINNDPDNYIQPVLYQDFITKEEAEYILNESSNNFQDSEVIGKGLDISIRKSKTCWLSKYDDIIQNIIKRVCNIVNYSFENSEDLQVVKYNSGGYYHEHYDSCCEESEECTDFFKRGGNRVVTMIIYLNDNFEGGETTFVNLNKDFKPSKYSGILFYSLDKSFEKCHKFGLHRGSPIISGEKYIANIWIREKTFV